MSRFSSPWLLGLTLLAGLLSGLALGRGGRSLSAQGGAQPAPAAVSPAQAPAQVTLGRGATEEEIYQQLARQYAQFEPINRTFEMVAKAVSPAVVHIVAQKTGRTEENGRVRHFEETGSGVIVRSDHSKGLYVLTNHHVVEGAQAPRVSIFLQDGRAIHPDRMWLDAKADIAVLNLGRDDLPAARLGDSEGMRVGNWVLALGSPFGLTHSVSQGIISARGRHMDELHEVENQDFLQTDAAINPGNSGGPLVNMKGEVIGINNSIASNGGGNEGVGFSIPINLARWIMNQLIATGHVTRGALGIDLHPEFRPEDALALGLDRPRGAWVDVVHASSPASQAGLKNGDVILEFRGTTILDLNHLINVVSMAPIGQEAELVVWRGKKSVNLRVRVGDRERTIAQTLPPPERVTPANGAAVAPRDGRGQPSRRPHGAEETATRALGAELLTLNDATARPLGLPSTLRGAVIRELTPESPLAPALRVLDVILSVNGLPVGTAEEAARALSRPSRETPLEIGYDRWSQGAVERGTVRVP